MLAVILPVVFGVLVRCCDSRGSCGQLRICPVHTSVSVQKLSSSLQQLESLGYPQSASLILRHCLGAAKVTFLLRSLPFERGAQLAAAVSPLLRRSWGIVCGVPFADFQWSLAVLPCRLGGLGVQYPVRLQPQATVSGFLSALGGPLGQWFHTYPQGLEQAVRQLLHSCPDLAAPLAAQWAKVDTQNLPAHPLFTSW